ncbi:TonB-dependent receptor plug domain-containing protein [Horticoccus sp. 23ND18S-11]|uniref:TonB-dependent receptor plug domain-containing protein n=1 Tax=Horticoccus sp. 23ND18S-11 TaxID=3391832 RepID=UPI0039C9DB64
MTFLSFRFAPRTFRVVAALMFPGLTPAGLVAQTVAAPATNAVAQDEALVLSPFVISTGRDAGFVAASSLAGGRLAGDLKDTPVAYSVQTREFIDALGLDSVTEASKWTVNVADVRDNGATEIFGAATQISFRGGSSAATQRDFFPFAVNYDSYNLERIDYARGPNAVLFGNGDFSGTINAVSRTARTDKSFNEVRLSYGSWANQRFTLDSNIALNRRVALRLDLLYADRGGWRKFDMERKRGATLAATVNVTSTTQLRLQGEVADVRRNNPFMTFTDRFTGWDGVTVLDARVPTTGLPSDATAKGYSQWGNATTPFFVYAPAFNGTLDLSRTGQTLGGNANASVPVGGQLAVGPSANIAGNPFNEALNLPGTRFDRAIAGSRFRYPGREFAVSSNNPSFVQPARAFSVFLNQRIGEHLFASLDHNYSRERRTTEYINSRGLPQVYIDINRNLPDGSANPEFLQPYSQGYRLRIRVGAQTESTRAALAYVLKNTRLGDFSVNTAWQHSNSNSVSDPTVFTAKRSTDPRTWVTPAYTDVVYYRYYWDKPDLPTPEVPSVNYNGTTYQTGWVKDIGGTTVVPAINYTKLDTFQAALKGTLFKGRIHLLGAARNDQYVAYSRFSRVPGEYPADWDGLTYYYRPDAPADYGTLSYTPKTAAGVPTGSAVPASSRPRTGLVAQPQYANDRFQDDYAPPEVNVKKTTFTVGGLAYVMRELGLFYNYSTTFNPSAARQNIYGSYYGPQVAAEWSAGLRQTLANGKLSATLGYYRGRQTGQVFDFSSTAQANLNTFATASPTPATGPAPAAGLGNLRGLTPVPRFFDTRDSNNEGYEFEVVANPTRALRLTVNGARPRTYQSNVAADFAGFYARNEPVLRQIAADTSVQIDSRTQIAAVNLAVPTTIRSPDANGVASAWNSLQTIRANVVGGSQLVTRLPLLTGNIFADYSFREGRLKGFKVGAGANYRGRQAISYRGGDTVVDPASPTNAIDDPSVGALDPVYMHGYTTGTLVFGKNFKLTAGYTLQLDFKIDNVLDYSAPLYVGTVQRPVGGNLSSPARVATPSNLYFLTPRNYTLSASVRF